jgi:hypothetical protein
MSVTVDRYATSKFILKDDAAVDHIKKIVDLLKLGQYLHTGYLSSDNHISLYEYGDRTYKFIGDGFCDSGPEIRASALSESDGEDQEYYEPEDEEDYYEEDPISLFEEIQRNLAKGTWFFVENHAVEKSYFSSHITFYHQNGKTDYRHSYDLKKQILEDHNVDGKVD